MAERKLVCQELLMKKELRSTQALFVIHAFTRLSTRLWDQIPSKIILPEILSRCLRFHIQESII